MPSCALLSSFTLLLSVLPIALANRHFDIVNNCPLSINLVINGNVQGSLASGATTTRDLPDIWSGFIYTDFNQGNVDGAGTVRAGFEGTNSYYYIVKDPKWLNVGLQITPIDRAPKGGFCLSLECEVTEGQCNDAFTSPPSRLPGSNPGVPPPAPLYQCPQTGTLPAGYRVTFCPDGTIPNYQTRPRNIQPKRDPQNKCLDVQGGVRRTNFHRFFIGVFSHGLLHYRPRRAEGRHVLCAPEPGGVYLLPITCGYTTRGWDGDYDDDDMQRDDDGEHGDGTASMGAATR
ncbi:hypothetical protein D9611_012245 [Ephemerocybe angulata]|uniref:Uncharacterized protein n=1 Tax=Ephemerocybe angulata TaxID=980116 RepID=A0A8H5AT64_9AGAR|nr:hypothetical protein D9611_012245 [Tulosesus angulatus]